MYCSICSVSYLCLFSIISLSWLFMLLSSAWFTFRVNMQSTVFPEIFTRRKFSPISPTALVSKIYICKSLSCINDYTDDMATFTTLAKLYSTKYFCNTKIAEAEPRCCSVVPKLPSLCFMEITAKEVLSSFTNNSGP